MKPGLGKAAIGTIGDGDGNSVGDGDGILAKMGCDLYYSMAHFSCQVLHQQQPRYRSWTSSFTMGNIYCMKP